MELTYQKFSRIFKEILNDKVTILMYLQSVTSLMLTFVKLMCPLLHKNLMKVCVLVQSDCWVGLVNAYLPKLHCIMPLTVEHSKP